MSIRTDYKIIIRAQTIDEEFDYLFKVFGKMSFYNEHGYKIPIPDHPFFLKISNDLDLLNTLDAKEAKDIFRKEVYSLEYFKNGLKTVIQEVDIIEKAIKKMGEWRNWGFKLFPKYEVRLTAYGPGGSYNCREGNIIIKTNEGGIFKRNPLHTIVHEIIHIGIEECIIKKFELTHIEKEGLVDAICTNYFKDILVNYTIQDRGDKNIFNIISENSLKNLPKEIEEYKKEIKVL
ncbi:hypothetical protein KJ586_00015 [Patescibacteria group bacterium]|nr:hypothetical protein [Patescibacteria group bacterium]MBU4454890.1 hypothetical protein [Patescibacteria group bacterium]